MVGKGPLGLDRGDPTAAGPGWNRGPVGACMAGLGEGAPADPGPMGNEGLGPI